MNSLKDYAFFIYFSGGCWALLSPEMLSLFPFKWLLKSMVKLWVGDFSNSSYFLLSNAFSSLPFISDNNVLPPFYYYFFAIGMTSSYFRISSIIEFVSGFLFVYNWFIVVDCWLFVTSNYWYLPYGRFSYVPSYLKHIVS